MNLFLMTLFAACGMAEAAPSDFYGELFAPALRSATRAKYEFRKYESRNAGGNVFQLEQHRFEAGTPLSSNDERTWKTSAYADYDGIDSGAAFSNGRIMPNRLWDLGAGLSYSRELEKGRSWSVGGSFSSASDRPFASSRELGISVNATYKLPQPDENAWIFFLGFSNTRGFLNYVPLPGAAYYWKVNPGLRLLLGLPFAMAFWAPSENWMVTAFWFPIRTAELKISYGKPRGLQPYALVSYRTKNYWLADRTDPKERLFFDEGLGQAGINVPVYRGVLLDLGVGNSFARRYYLAQKATQRKDAPGISADNAFFGNAKLSAFF